MPFDFEQTYISGLIKITPKIFFDERGFFLELYKKSEFRKMGINLEFYQDNFSYSKKNILRGLHFQRAPHAQAKLIGCLYGRIFDVAVDLREGSPTFGQYYSIELDAKTHTLLYLPAGLAHGFYTLSESALVFYKVDKEFCAAAEDGIVYHDPVLNIEWPKGEKIVSGKDLQLPFFKPQ